MGNSQQIEFIIRKDGTVEEQVTGVSGPECEAITKAVEDALGQVTERTRTGDYFNNAQSSGDTVSTSA